MYDLHTTDALVLRALPRGESSMVFSLFTKGYGRVHAHAAGIRELRAKNRSALQIGNEVLVTLVKGREWRVASVREQGALLRNCSPSERVRARHILQLLARLTGPEMQSPEIYVRVVETLRTFSLPNTNEAHAAREAATVLAVLAYLGYVADTDYALLQTIEQLMRHEQPIVPHTPVLIKAVNSALQQTGL